MYTLYCWITRHDKWDWQLYTTGTLEEVLTDMFSLQGHTRDFPKLMIKWEAPNEDS